MGQVATLPRRAAAVVYSANIHHFFPHPVTGAVEHDDDGEPMLGHYFEIMRNDIIPVTGLIGPYGSATECEKACAAEYRRVQYATA